MATLTIPAPRPPHPLRVLADLVLPTRCGGCAAPGNPWCARCRQSLALAPPPQVWTPTPAPPGLPLVWTMLPYDGVIRTCLVNWKDGGRRDLAAVLAPLLTEVLLAALLACPDPPLVVPAPSAPASIRRRGDYPLQQVTARAVAAVPRALRPPHQAVLRLGRGVADQAGLDRRGRAENLSGAVVVPAPQIPRVRGRLCLVVDDVITTGSTLAESARALRAAGATDVLAVTIAATHRRSRVR